MFATKVVLGGKTSNSFQRGTFISSGTLRATQVSKRAGTGVKTNTKKRKHKNALESKYWLLVLILASLVKVYLAKKRSFTTHRSNEKGGPADTGLLHWACCSRRYRVTIKSSVGGDGGRVVRGISGRRR